MHYQPNDITVILELKDLQDSCGDVVGHADDTISEGSATPPMQGSSVMWSNLVVILSTMSGVTRLGRTIVPPGKMTYVLGVELRYLQEMADLGHTDTAALLSFRHI